MHKERANGKRHRKLGCMGIEVKANLRIVSRE